MNEQLEIIESQTKKITEELSDEQELDAQITVNTRPYDIGITSQVIVSVMGLLENRLEIKIPANCYIFHEKRDNRQLSIKEAAVKLYKTINK